MRTVLLFGAAVLLTCSAALAAAPPAALFPAMKDGKWGFIDATGRMVIPPKFGAVGNCVRNVFVTGLAPVKSGGRWVYIDRAGKPVVRIKADEDVHFCGPFVAGLARVSVGRIRLGDIGRLTTGYIHQTGRFVIRPRFVAARDFCEGFAAVRLERRWAYVDKKGTVLVKELGYAYDFRGGRALVRDDRAGRGRWGLIDKTGKMVVEFPAMERCRPLSEGLAAFVRAGKWGYVDAAGRVVVAPRFRLAEDFHDGVAAVWIPNPNPKRPRERGMLKCRFIDRRGRFITDTTFDSGYSFREGLAPVRLGDQYGYLDTQGELPIKPQYASAGPFSDGLAAVRKDGQFVYVDKTGRVAVVPKAEVTFGGPFTRGLARVHLRGDRLGYVDRAGTVVYRWVKPPVVLVD